MLLSVLPEWLLSSAFALVAVAPFVAIFVIYFVVVNARTRKRRQALQGVAEELGLTFEPDGWSDPAQADGLTTALFRKGRVHRFKNVVAGNLNGAQIRLFDYSFQTLNVDGKYRSVAQTVAAFAKEGRSLPDFEVFPAGLMQKIGGALAYKNIRLDANPEFSDRYHIVSADEEHIRRLFAPAIVSALDAIDPKKRWSFEGAGQTLVTYRLGKRIPATDIPAFLDETGAIAQVFFSQNSGIV